MQLKIIYLIALLLVGLSVSAFTSSSQASDINLKWTQASLNEVFIDVILPSGIEVKGIRYRKDKLSQKWLLQLKSTSGTVIQSGERHFTSLSQKDFKNLFSELVSSIKDNNDGQLDQVHIGLEFVTELWEETVFYLRKNAVPSSYKLTRKDSNLAKKISLYLESTEIIRTLCDQFVQIQKFCKDNFVDMNPVTFEPGYIGKEWNQVEKIPNVGIPTDKLWFGLSLSNMVRQYESGN